MIYTQLLNNTGGSVISALAISAGASIYTQKVDSQRGVDSALILVLAGATGNLSIAQEVSVDGVKFYTPYDLGGVTSMGNVGSALLITTGMYIALNQATSCPVITPYKRFVFTAHSAVTLSAYYLQQE